MLLLLLLLLLLLFIIIIINIIIINIIVFFFFNFGQLWSFVKNKMLKHDSNCLETANEEDGTPALLLNCDESNTNQVKTRIPLVGVKILYYLENVPNVPSKNNNLIPLQCK